MGAEAAEEQATGTMGNESGGAKKWTGHAHMTSARNGERCFQSIEG